MSKWFSSDSIPQSTFGLKAFAAALIAFNIMSIPVYSNIKPYLAAYINPFGMILYSFGFIASLLQIMLAANILLLKEWARRFLLILMVVYVAVIFFNRFAYDKNYWQSVEENLRAKYSQTTEEEKKIISDTREKLEVKIKKYPPEQQVKIRQIYQEWEKDFPVIIFRSIKLISSITSLFWYLLIIYYFSRPDVKKQFK